MFPLLVVRRWPSRCRCVLDVFDPRPVLVLTTRVALNQQHGVTHHVLAHPLNNSVREWQRARAAVPAAPRLPSMQRRAGNGRSYFLVHSISGIAEKVIMLLASKSSEPLRWGDKLRGPEDGATTATEKVVLVLAAATVVAV